VFQFANKSFFGDLFLTGHVSTVSNHNSSTVVQSYCPPNFSLSALLLLRLIFYIFVWLWENLITLFAGQHRTLSFFPLFFFILYPCVGCLLVRRETPGLDACASYIYFLITLLIFFNWGWRFQPKRGSCPSRLKKQIGSWAQRILHYTRIFFLFFFREYKQAHSGAELENIIVVRKIS
jgi:hypothetical protein